MSERLGKPYFEELTGEYYEAFMTWRKILQEEYTLVCDLPGLGQNGRFSAHGHMTALQRIIFEALLADQKRQAK